MKNLSMINWNKMFSTILKPTALALVLVLAFSNVKANDKIKPAEVEIKYIGKTNGNPIFQINFENAQGDNVYLALRDEYGNTIFGDFVKEKGYSRKIQFDNVDLSDLKLTLTLRSKNGTHKQNFQISKNVQLVENVEVAKK